MLGVFLWLLVTFAFPETHTETEAYRFRLSILFMLDGQWASMVHLALILPLRCSIGFTAMSHGVGIWKPVLTTAISPSPAFSFESRTTTEETVLATTILLYSFPFMYGLSPLWHTRYSMPLFYIDNEFKYFVLCQIVSKPKFCRMSRYITIYFVIYLQIYLKIYLLLMPFTMTYSISSPFVLCWVLNRVFCVLSQSSAPELHWQPQSC